MTIKLNGPINVVRMEGHINNIKKVIYIFMDEHIDIDQQTDCNDPHDSIDINIFFRNSFENLKYTKKTYDFFLETFPHGLAYDLNESLYSTRTSEEIYIEKLWKFFYESVHFDKKNNTLTSLFSNVRLHYIDIRNVLYSFIVDPLLFAIHQLSEIHNLTHDIVNTSLETVINFLKKLQIMLSTNNFHSSKQQIITKLDSHIIDFLLNANIRQKYFDQFSYLLNKLVNGYNHINVKKKLVNIYVKKFIFTKLEDYIYDLDLLYDKVKNLTGKDYENNDFVKELKNDLNHFHQALFAYAARFVDLYFLRRFLDKDYVTNAIIYTGAAHSVSYIYILNSFNFEITHCAYSAFENIDHLNKAVSNIKNFPFEDSLFDLIDLFVLLVSKQCSDISDFPDNFQ